ncbi:hypothetical protein [Pontibacter sp. G13]|uniref:phasin family protein n=1 Tax=Pontibacter sp. G13 TaxID=3074898 RepID=UPI00288946FE|nr:hypothetical protein [Pontibacter sp. G13]WNJ21483.1 hypothetical protein RJD25_13520 [Pontibacter sp. G13]
MEDVLKKFLYTGVGLVALTAEKLQETVDEMVGQGKVSKDEGKKIVEDFFDKVDAKRDEMEQRMKEMADNFAESIQIPKMATKTEMQDLVERIEALEAQLTTKGKTAVKKTASRAKKSTGSASASAKAKDEE